MHPSGDKSRADWW